MKILAAEDNPISQSMLRSMLTKWGYEVITATDGNEAWRALQMPDAPQMAILDWMMPGQDGVEVCRQLRAVGREPYTYVLLLTARSDAQDLVEALDAGADDYLTKPFNSSELRARLRAGRRIVELQAQLLEAQEALRERATHDGLTRLYNRSAILEILRQELARATRDPQPLSIVMADLDHFKEINDTHGHLTGDEVLREASRRMKAAMRSYDSIGRYGGEEFLAVLPGCDGSNAWLMSERLRRNVGDENFVVGDIRLPITCSLGCATQPMGMSWDADSLIRLADGALYGAKHGGRNRTEVAQEELVT
ncbi:MAG: diguanylate cyclase [Acidobacteriia bacterium]|nr:diguanylate cyclase [Terriglobia bacterium]MBV8905101.1 diguanylate cyclase [Terriglobia bacterium]